MPADHHTGIPEFHKRIMLGAAVISTSVSLPFRHRNPTTSAGILSTQPQLNEAAFHSTLIFKLSSHSSLLKGSSSTPIFLPKAAASSSSVESTQSTEEPATKVRFQKLLTLPGCSSSLSLLGTGYREKVFAIIGVKVYAAGLYVDQSVLSSLDACKGKSAAQIQEDSSTFEKILQAPLEKSLQIVLVRDVDGKTFWNALDEAISPRIKSPTSVDTSALSTFRSIFQERALKKGTFIFLTWLNPATMLAHVSSGGMPSQVDATIDSENVTSALFDVFLGSDPVSPTLKASVANGLASALK